MNGIELCRTASAQSTVHSSTNERASVGVLHKPQWVEVVSQYCLMDHTVNIWYNFQGIAFKKSD